MNVVVGWARLLYAIISADDTRSLVNANVFAPSRKATQVSTRYQTSSQWISWDSQATVGTVNVAREVRDAVWTAS